MKRSYILGCAMLVLFMFGSCVRSDVIKNPTSVLQVTIPPGTHYNYWKILESDDNVRLRLSYAPMRDLDKEIIIAFDPWEVEISELSLPEFSQNIQDMILGNYIVNNGVELITDDILPQETTINNYRAIQYDSGFYHNGNVKLYLSVIVAEAEKHSIIITILCNEKDYSVDRTHDIWKVIDSVSEIIE